MHCCSRLIYFLNVLKFSKFAGREMVVGLEMSTKGQPESFAKIFPLIFTVNMYVNMYSLNTDYYTICVYLNLFSIFQYLL